MEILVKGIYNSQCQVGPYVGAFGNNSLGVRPLILINPNYKKIKPSAS